MSMLSPSSLAPISVAPPVTLAALPAPVWLNLPRPGDDTEPSSPLDSGYDGSDSDLFPQPACERVFPTYPAQPELGEARVFPGYPPHDDYIWDRCQSPDAFEDAIQVLLLADLRTWVLSDEHIAQPGGVLAVSTRADLAELLWGMFVLYFDNDGFEGSAGDWLLQLGRGQQASTGRYAKDLNFAWYSPEESLILRRLILLTGKHLIRLDAASDTEDIRPYKGDESREEWQKAWGRIVERRLDCALQFQRRFSEMRREIGIENYYKHKYFGGVEVEA